MRELIPSKDVRNYLQKVGRKFNDFERATLIYKFTIVIGAWMESIRH